MSTSGQITFIAGGHAKRSYAQHDAYASGLGLQVLSWLRDVMGRDHEPRMRQAIEALTVVSDFGGYPPPTDGHRIALGKYERTNVGTDDEPWYRLLRETMGRPADILQGGYAYDQDYGTEFIEYYNYVVDADRREFRALGHTWSFDALPTNGEFTLQVEDD